MVMPGQSTLLRLAVIFRLNTRTFFRRPRRAQPILVLRIQLSSILLLRLSEILR
jgi:hypothetical protein